MTLAGQTAAEVAGVHRRRRPVASTKGYDKDAGLRRHFVSAPRLSTVTVESQRLRRCVEGRPVDGGEVPAGLGARTPTESILKVLTRPVADLHFATQEAADELPPGAGYSLALWRKLRTRRECRFHTIQKKGSSS